MLNFIAYLLHFLACFSWPQHKCNTRFHNVSPFGLFFLDNFFLLQMGQLADTNNTPLSICVFASSLSTTNSARHIGHLNLIFLASTSLSLVKGVAFCYPLSSSSTRFAKASLELLYPSASTTSLPTNHGSPSMVAFPPCTFSAPRQRRLFARPIHYGRCFFL